MSTQRHALIIEDNPGNAMVLATMLTREGILSTEVYDPADLPVALAGVAHLDLIFLDLGLPGGDAFQIKRMLAEDTRFQQTPIVAYTAYTSRVDEARRAGFDGFISKPIRMDVLPSQVERILRGESVWE